MNTTKSLIRVAYLCAMAFASHTTNALAESDDFDDGNDVGWTRYSPLSAFGAGGVFSFPAGGYRIQTTAPSPNPTALGPARAGTYRSTSYTDFYISVDIVNWNDALPQAAGILARVGTPGLGTTTGYAFTWDRGTTSTSGDMDISRITAEAATGASGQQSANDSYHFVPGRTYRLVFIGRGSLLEGRLYEFPDLTTPKVIVTANDNTYPSGVSGLVVFDNSATANNLTDTTFDNFVNLDVEPPTLKISVPDAFGEIAVSWPMSYFNGGFKLQYSTTLPAASWQTIPDNLYFQDPMDADRIQYVTPTNVDPTTFFRLRRP
jgi:hypothetical protein